eukprot:6178965-Pleurochrysis_carterae.AAC.2
MFNFCCVAACEYRTLRFISGGGSIRSHLCSLACTYAPIALASSIPPLTFAASSRRRRSVTASCEEDILRILLRLLRALVQLAQGKSTEPSLMRAIRCPAASSTLCVHRRSAALSGGHG